MKNEILLEYYDNQDEGFWLSVESYLTVFLCVYIEFTDQLSVKLLKSTENDKSKSVLVNLSHIQYQIDDLHKIKSKLPILIIDNVIICGLCGVLRRILKLKNSEISKKLMGFRENCLMAPSETSRWTRFCEQDMVKCTQLILSAKNELLLPEEMAKLERDLGNPIRMHNVYKIARDKDKSRTIKSGIPIEQLNVDHTFCQGNELSLADLILFPYYKQIFNKVHQDTKDLLPLSWKWFQNIVEYEDGSVNRVLEHLSVESPQNSLIILPVTHLDDPEYFSLLKRDLTGFKHKNRAYTEQGKIDPVLEKIKLTGISIRNDQFVENYDKIDDKFVEDLLTFGELPAKRLEKKKQQLKSMAVEVLSISRPNDIIVDFCSGTGHLGILMAQLLPRCKIIILENKEESIERASKKVKSMELTNIQFFQCNLEYFNDFFTLGVSLHACGVATDIVLAKCWNVKANFVSSPCCYGKIQNIEDLVELPQSRVFRDANISPKDFIFLAHCADQTHDERVKNCNVEKAVQGKFCMSAVDTDRKLRAEELGYEVKLKTLFPKDCSPKNALICGTLHGF